MTPANALANALVNVLVVDDEPLARRRLVRHLRQLPWVAQVEEAADVRQALEALARFNAHILLLDIQMPGGSGFDLVARLPDPAPAIVFVTAFGDQACRAFDANAVDYVTKPIEPGRLRLALERARRAVALRDSADRLAELEEVVASLRRAAAPRSPGARELWVKSGGHYVRIDTARITRIQAERDYARIHADGRSYLHGENLAALARGLPADEFIRIHRSTLVRVDAVTRLEVGPLSSLAVVLRDGDVARVGRTHTAQVRARLMRRGG